TKPVDANFCRHRSNRIWTCTAMAMSATAGSDVCLVGPQGSGRAAIARLLQLDEATAPFIPIDGTLMDAELMQAFASPAMEYLVGGGKRATLLIRSLDQMPGDAMEVLTNMLQRSGDALRLIGTMQQTIGVAPDNYESTLSPGVQLRMSALTIQVPALARRLDDLLEIAMAIIQQRHFSASSTAQRISRSAIEKMMQYPWPGNIDELQNAMRHAANQCSGDAIRIEDLPLAIRSYHPNVDGVSDAAAAGQGPLVSESNEADFPEIHLDGVLQRYEEQLIVAAVRACGGNKAAAARRLNISRPRLLRRLSELEIRQSAETDE
ncbi:MAG: helix-turn-helix domain-containing protein, partial [Planctomycetota bacterium]